VIHFPTSGRGGTRSAGRLLEVSVERGRSSTGCKGQVYLLKGIANFHKGRGTPDCSRSKKDLAKRLAGGREEKRVIKRNQRKKRLLQVAFFQTGTRKIWPLVFMSGFHPTARAEKKFVGGRRTKKQVKWGLRTKKGFVVLQKQEVIWTNKFSALRGKT